MTTATIDHLVVTATDLDAGCAHVAACLGRMPSGGGRHDRMGTHNRLLRIGATTYLEVIAIDPDAKAPARPRWFGLDARDARDAPRLVGWMARVDGIATVTTSLPTSLRDALGPVTPMRRDDLAWSLTVPDDGALVDGGALPGLIDWGSTPHPTTRLRDDGLVLEQLLIECPDPSALRAALDAMRVDGPVTVAHGAVVRLAARIRAPDGARLLT